MANEDGEIWFVAGGEPGAQRFGQLVQRRRKEQRQSVQDLADKAALSVGTIRAIEQGRRAPSEESGVRLLRLVLPEGALSRDEGSSPDYSFLDPYSGKRIWLEFKAKTAGDNRRWSIDKPSADESRQEALLRKLMNDPERWAAWKQNALPAIELFSAVAAQAAARVGRPAPDASLGKVIRRLTIADEVRMDRIERLLDWWDEVDGGIASEAERARTAKVNDILDAYYFKDGE